MKSFFKRRLGQGLLVLIAMVALLSGCKESPGTRVCTVRGDCETGERCGLDGRCTKDEQKCQSDSSCSIDEYCKFESLTAPEGKCEAYTCQSSSGTDTCGAKHTCLNDYCVPGCDDKSDCASNEVCDQSSHQCARRGCNDDRQCDQFQRCDTSGGGATGVCVYSGKCSCSDEEDCKTSATGNDLCGLYASAINSAEEYECNRTQCKKKPACQTSTDCGVGSGMICVDVKTNGSVVKACRPGCLTDRDCQKSGGLGQGQTKVICKKSPNPEFDWKTCQTGCLSRKDCGLTEACVDSVCQKTCIDKSTCQQGEVCGKTTTSGSNKLCRHCYSNSECTAAQKCVFLQDENGVELKEGLCKAYTSCPDDAYGPNFEPSSPYQIASLPFEATGDKRANFCSADKYKAGDFFQFNLAPNDVVDVTLSYENESNTSNLDLTLIEVTSSGSKQVVSSVRPPFADGGTEHVRYGVSSASVFLVKVTGTSVNDFVPYNLSIVATPFATCTDDSLDPNSESMPRELTNTEYGRNTDAEWTDLHVCSNAKDYYKFTLLDKSYAQFDFNYEESLGHLDVKLYSDATLTTEVPNVKFENKRLRIGPDVAKSGVPYYMVVELPAGEVGQVDYSMSWQNYRNICVDDSSKNDVCSDATNLPLKDGDVTATDFEPDFTSISESYNVCKSDYYKFLLLPQHNVEIDFCYGGNVTSEVDGQPTLSLHKSYSAGCSNINTVPVTDVGTYSQLNGALCKRIRISSVDPAPNGFTSIPAGEYALEYSVFAGGRVSYKVAGYQKESEACLETPVNTDIEKAVVFDQAKAKTGTDNTKYGYICDQGKYWYKADIEGNEDYKFLIRYTKDPSFELSAKLYFVPKGKTLDNSTDEVTKESYKVGEADPTSGEVSCSASTCNTDGTLYVEVFAEPAARVSFRLSFEYGTSGPKGGAKCPDSREDNDDWSKASQLTANAHIDDLSVCYLNSETKKSDGDFYYYEVSPGDTVTFTATKKASSPIAVNVAWSCFQPDGTNNCQLADGTEPSTAAHWKRMGGGGGNYSLTDQTYDRKGKLYFYLALRPQSGDVEALYSLQLDVNNTSCSAGPASTAEGTPTKLADNISQTYFRSRVCENGSNFFTVKVPAKTSTETKWSVVTRYMYDDANLETVVKKKSAGSWVDVTPEGTANSDLTIGSRKKGKVNVFSRPTTETEYLIEVKGVESRAEFALVINMDYKDAGPNIDTLACPDRFRPASSSSRTSNGQPLLGQGTEENLSICNTPKFVGFGNSDAARFRYTVYGKSTLTVKATYECFAQKGATGDPVVNLSLYKGSSKVSTGSTTGMTTTLTYENNDVTNAETLLEVSINKNGYCSYSLEASIAYDSGCTAPDSTSLAGVSAGETTGTGPDAAKTKAQSASAITQTMSSKAIYLCENTEQVFKLAAGITKVNADILFVDAMGTLNATLFHYDGSGHTVTDGTSTSTVGGRATLNVDSLSPTETYYVALNSVGDARVLYKIWLKTSKGQPTLTEMCRDDKEINDNISVATEIPTVSASSTYSALYQSDQLNVCWADEDWIKVVKDTSDYYVGVYGTYADKLKVEFLDSTGAALATPVSATGSGGVAELNVTGQPAGTYYVKIASKDATPPEEMSPYMVLATPATAFGAGCTVDDFDKTNPSTSIPLVDTYPKTYFGTVCSNSAADIDVYTAKVASGKKVKVTIYSKSDADASFTYYDSSQYPSDVPISFTGGKATHTFISPSSDSYQSVTVKGAAASNQFPYFITFEEVP